MSNLPNLLLTEAIDAHGGFDNWRRFKGVASTIITGGRLWGIKGAKMPAGGATPQKPDGLSPADIWHLVDYVRSLPYQPGGESPSPETTAHLQAN